MDKQSASRLITNTFDYPFDIGKYKLLSRNIFKEFEEAEFSREGTTYIPEAFRSHIKKYARLGTYEDTQGKAIDILIVYINEGIGLDRARTLQRNFISNYLDDLGKDAALVAFTTSDMEDWRFSLITIEYKTIQDESGKIKTKKVLSSAKRFSFLVGKNEANHTAQQQVIPLLTNSNNPSIEDLEQAFSVEQVTDEFYQDYKKRFLELGYEINRVIDKDEKIKRDFSQQNINTDNFAKKLMGQIVFLYFVQKKGWLGVGKDDDGNFLKWGEGDKKFMRSLFEKKFCEYDNYFNDVLEPLFYEALATERANNYYSKFECKIPFLSGGLFEAMNGYNWQETDITISNNVIEMILDTFDRYNFTVKEDDPLDKEVAIDPEMLGKVFENLLPENLKKGNGAFYTPRPIVHYMCKQSLINYLDTHLNIDKKDITLLVKEGEAVVEHDKIANTKEEGYEGKYQQRMPNSIIENANEIDELLTYVKICDPAIGSGAFPMGLLHEIVVARDVLTNYIGNDESRRKYKLKSDCIQNSIYGVDIDEGAIEISKLRLWLSLIVDEDNIENIKPLPNLDYKIICGNSLISRYALDSPIDVVFSEFNKKVKSKDYTNSAIKNLVGNQEVDLNFYKNITNDFLIESSHNKKILFRELIGEIKKAFKTELDDKDRAKLSEARGALENISRIDIFGEQVGTNTEINKAKKKLEKLKKAKQETQDGAIYKNAIEWRFEFPNLLNNNGDFTGFDIVIANPPYLPITMISENEKLIFKKQYQFAKGRFNLFYLFTEVAKVLTKPNAHTNLIVPDRLLLNIQLKEFRKWLLFENQITELISFKDSVFQAVVDSVIVGFLNKTNTLEAILAKPNISIDILHENEHISIPVSFFTNSPTSQFELNYNRTEAELTDKILNRSVNLGSISQTKDGIIQGAVSDLLFLKEIADNESKRLLFGKDINKYHLTFNDNWVNYKKEKMMKVEMLRVGNKGPGLRMRNKSIFESQKILTRQTADKIIATIDLDHYYYSNTIHGTIITDSNYSIYYVLGLLNSKLIEWYYKTNIAEKGKVFAQVKIALLRTLPILKSNKNEQALIADLVLKLLNTDVSICKEDRLLTESRLNLIIYKIYNLNYKEILIVDEEFAMSEVEYNNFEL